MLAIDASVVVPAVSDDGAVGHLVRLRFAEEALVAPQILFLEVAAALRRHVATGRLDAERGSRALRRLMALPFREQAHQPLLPRVWQLRDNLTSYDASYIAVAEALRVPLLTADARLARAPGIRCRTELLSI